MINNYIVNVSVLLKYSLLIAFGVCSAYIASANETAAESKVQSTAQCEQFLSAQPEPVEAEINASDVSSMLSKPDRPLGTTLNVQSGLELLESYSSHSSDLNQIFVILKVKVSTPSAVRRFLGIVEQKAVSNEIIWREDLTYFRYDPNAEEQNLEIPVGGNQDQITKFLEDIMASMDTQGLKTVEDLSVEIIDLGDAQKQRTSPILIGHGQLSIQGIPSKIDSEAKAAFAKAEDLIARERLSVPILQLGLSKELNGYSPFIVMVPSVNGIFEAIQSEEKTIIDIKDGFEELSENWIKHFLKVAKGRAIYSVKNASSHYYLMNGDNYSKIDAYLMEMNQTDLTNDDANDFPAELLGMIKTCLGCESRIVSNTTMDSTESSQQLTTTGVVKGSRRLYPQNIQPAVLRKIQIAADKDGAKFALRDSFPREMNSMGARLDEIVLRMLERMGAEKEEISSYFKELESWDVDYHLDIFQWGLNRNGKCRNNYTCYMLLKVIESLGSIYNMKGLGASVDIQTLHTYEGMREFLDNLGFPKIHDGKRVITSKVLNDLQRLIDSQLALEPLVGQYNNPNPREISAEESGLVNEIFSNSQSGGAKALMDLAQELNLLEASGYPNTVSLISRMRVNLNSNMLSSVLSVGGRTELTRDRLRELEISIRNLNLQPEDLELALRESNSDSLMRILSALELLTNLWNQNSKNKVDSGSVYHYYPLQRFIELTQEERPSQ